MPAQGAPATFKAFGAVLALLAATACANDTQTSSGADFVAARPGWAAQAGGGTRGVDRAVLEAASAEPLLRFPARIGLARLSHGRLTGVPAEEADAWIAMLERLGPGYGQVVPVSPLLAGFDAQRRDASRSPVDDIRIAAARQHIDAVLIYEVTSASRDRATVLSAADFTIIGAFLIPSRSLQGTATAAALLVDVRNGYPYGSALANAQQGGISTSVGSYSRLMDVQGEAQVAAVRNLTGEVATMFERLGRELDARPAPAAPTPPQRPRRG